ncbi:MAG: hypothetical protein AAFN59_09485 [Pseudomonadota bacterium]
MRNMSTWTSKLALGAVLFLAGCGDGFDAFAPATRTAPDAVAVTGDIVVTGPAGYCVDEGATRLGQVEAFVLLGSCAAITRDGRQPSPRDPAIIAVSVRAGVDVSLDDLSTLFGGVEPPVPGDQNAAVLQADLGSDALFLRTSDGGTETWRALLPVAGTLISARILAAPATPMTPEATRAALDDLTQALVAANPA